MIFVDTQQPRQATTTLKRDNPMVIGQFIKRGELHMPYSKRILCVTCGICLT